MTLEWISRECLGGGELSSRGSPYAALDEVGLPNQDSCGISIIFLLNAHYHNFFETMLSFCFSVQNPGGP